MTLPQTLALANRPVPEQATSVWKALLESPKEPDDRFRVLQAVFDSSPDAIAVIDANGRYLAQNAAHRALIGYTNDELVDRTPEIHLGAELFPDLVRQLQETGRFHGEVKSRTKAGTDLILELNAFTVLDEDGRIVGHVGINRDITDRKRAEENLRQMNLELEERVQRRTAQLENAVRELESFNYSVSHDLRTPLRTIRGFAHLLLRDAGKVLDEESRGHLHYVYDATERMSEIIENLLKLSRVNRAELRREEVDLSAMANEIIERLRRSHPERNVIVDIDPQLRVVADRQLMRVVLENLLENAWKFTGRHSTAKIEFGRADSDGQRLFYVRDDGAGFDLASAEKLFQPFTRLHHASEFDGTGIGLATVQRIIQRHGGKIHADAKPEQGATFYFAV